MVYIIIQFIYDIDNDLKDIENPDLLYPCPFRFEKPDKNNPNYESLSESEDSLDIAELADFNKLMERHLKESLKEEFHDKFHKIDKLQNKEIDNKMKQLAKQRNTGQLKYLLKKRVNNFKDNIGNVKIQLEKLDDDFIDPNADFSNTKSLNAFFSNKKNKSVPPKTAHKMALRNKENGFDVEDNMKNALSRKFPTIMFRIQAQV